ncbi:MAG TPA: acyl-CoA dehydrogenase family protein [Methylomirabilota bacterium]|jgi:acyl-CoA dehydrogenase
MKVFNEQHAMFRGAVRGFVEKEVMPHVEEWEVAGRMPRAIFRRMGELGFFGVEYDEKYGGAAADFMTSAVLHEECARSRSGSFAMAVGVHADMASPHLYWTGSEPLKERYLPGICRGELLTAIAVTEPGGGSDVAAIRTRARLDGGHYVLNGTKIFITNGDLADIYFVAARVEAGDADRRHRGISMFVVERNTPGFTVSRTLDKMGMRASDTAELVFQDARVPADNLLGREGVGFYEVMRVFQRERLVAGLHAVSMAQRALEDTMAYLRQRQAFGGPLSEKQAIRHRVADLATLIEAGRWLTYAVCLRYQAGEDAVSEISMVKLFTSEMVNRVAYECVQLHGGYGYMREYPIERFARDARLMTIGGGTSEIMREVIAKHLGGGLDGPLPTAPRA